MLKYSSQISSDGGKDPAQVQLKHGSEIQFRRAVNFRSRYEGANDHFWAIRLAPNGYTPFGVDAYRDTVSEKYKIVR